MLQSLSKFLECFVEIVKSLVNIRTGGKSRKSWSERIVELIETMRDLIDVHFVSDILHSFVQLVLHVQPKLIVLFS